MILLPAIDLYGGKVVRLSKGDFDARTEYGGAPRDVAARYAEAGCEWIHIVDLEGAKEGAPRHLGVLEELRGLGLRVEYGGGLRRKEDLRAARDAGAERLMAGSILFRREGIERELFDDFGTAIMPSIDVKDGEVAVAGWMEGTGMDAETCLRRLCAVGYRTFLVTAVERDGMLAGPDLSLYRALSGVDAEARIVAAGGVSTVEDIPRLRALGLYGAVVGKALYETDFDLPRAIAAAGGA